MLRLRVLGNPFIEGASGSGAAGQRKSLALLAVLADAGDRALSRDRVATYLWPDADTRKAFHRLSQQLHAIRRDLGSADLFVGAAALRLNPRLITSDIAEFRAAYRAGAWEQAVSHYGGPFLDGFFLRGAPDFERWVESTRATLAREYADALETLAAEASGRGDARRAAEWWRRVAEMDPLSSRVAIHLMSMLAAAGDRAGALEHARAYETLVGAELGVAPNPAVVALAGRLRHGPLEGSAPAVRPPRPVTVGLLPWGDFGDTRRDGFAEGLMDDLATALSRVDGVQVLDRRSVAPLATCDAREIGHRLGADAVIEGSLRWAGDRVRVTVQLVSTTDGCYRWSDRHDLEVTDSFRAQDELTERIVRALRPLLGEFEPTGPAPAGQRDR